MSGPTVRKDICGECPFRREAAQGYLGKNDPETFVEEAVSEQSVSCHKMMNQELRRPEWLQAEAEAPRCRGALTLMRNQCKLPRDPAMAALVKTVETDREKVFSHRLEFIKYHEAASVQSWTFED